MHCVGKQICLGGLEDHFTLKSHSGTTTTTTTSGSVWSFPTATVVDCVPTRPQNNFRTDLGFAQEKVRTSIVDLRSTAAKTHWQMWVDFCASHSLDHQFPKGDDIIPCSQVFAMRCLNGHIAPSRWPVQSDTVHNAMQIIGQVHARMGTSDPRLNAQGKLDLCLQQLFRACKKKEPLAHQVKPMALSVVTKLLMCFDNDPNSDDGNSCIANMTCIGFFFVRHPEEHTKSDNNTLFKSQDV